MAHPLFLPGKYFFYPIGNTSAVCLTRDVSPEESADILLLGCGDPRSVLYTIFSEPQAASRHLDFTCCDFDPGILARNVLLFTLIADRQPAMGVVWNIFFHMYLDKASHTVLVDQCKKLLSISDTLQRWASSSYGSYLKMGTEYTLSEVRRHWSLYAGMQDLPPARLKAITTAFSSTRKGTLEKHSGLLISPARSAGPLMMLAIPVMSEHFKRYWKTGLSLSDQKQADSATLVNPTFAYSLGGEGFNVHYGTDPLVPFHLASVFGNAKGTASVVDVVKAAKSEFKDWCDAYEARVSPDDRNPPVVRFILGEVTAVCRAFHAFTSTGTVKSEVPVAQWKTQILKLNEEDYISGGAPSKFHVIETSNLIDHVGLLNIIVAAAPLLSTSGSPGVLYTESLLFRGEDATKDFTEQLYANLTIVGMLVGLYPTDYLSGFTSRSNTHELMAYMVVKKDTTQFHQVTTWKSPIYADAIAGRYGTQYRPPIFDPLQLGTFLYDMYHQIFEQEDAMNWWKRNQNNMRNALASSVIIHYMRESFALFLKLVRTTLRTPDDRWRIVMNRFFDLREEDKSLPMDSNNSQDLFGQLMRYGIYTAPYLSDSPPRIGLFSQWETVPPLVRIILTVPREKLALLYDTLDQVGTPPLQCDLRGQWSHNIFTAVHAAFGTAIRMGTVAKPWVMFNEDPDGWKGSSPLVVSFTVATPFLTDIEPQTNLNVRFGVRSTPGTVILIQKLGFDLIIFSGKLLDEASVLVIPEPSVPFRAPRVVPPTSSISDTIQAAQIGTAEDVSVQLDEQCELVESMTCRVIVEDSEVKGVFTTGTNPQVEQVSPCVMRLMIAGHSQDIVYPFPVIGSKNRCRLARKSLYIEVVVPASGPFKDDGMQYNPYPMIVRNESASIWSVHRVNLSRLPVLGIKNSKDLYQWLNPHVGSMMSKRERSARKKNQDDTLMFVKDTLHTIMVRASGIQQGPSRRLFALVDKATKNSDTVIFINDIRFDQPSHTVVYDGYVLALTHDLLAKIESNFAKLVTQGDIVNVAMFGKEVQAWKQLLPVFVERCRTSWVHGANCEYKSQGRIPLSEDMENDPLCSCGRGIDTDGMTKVNLWRPFAPYVTRIALSPLFAVSYLETVGRDPSAHKCFVCRGKGKPRLLACKGCMKVRYCSEACQKKHWKAHKANCKR
ncbi:uncharacterized protein FIBRA_06254 [Fibroporia radiculosa]|uniref:MYND-type domain-containing protein n=1 Tax=Fibroporia radiculosa TaxID=599839 RepID=J4GSF0_9APHY|nr:uncharacterized protein FIBRA_06254 [Fibroporia radiculosa]CCM04095.1 predicted protein [Fibroporia radiculosa]